MKVRIPSVNQVQPGILVVHSYTSEIGIVLYVSPIKDRVDVLLGNGKIVVWGIEGFRSCYGIPS